MYVLSISTFAANWLLLLCLIGPLCGGAGQSRLADADDSTRFRPLPTPDEVSGKERQHEFSVQNQEHTELYDYAVPRLENRELLKHDVGVSQLEDQRDEETRKRDKEIMRTMNILNKMLSEDSNENDVESKNTIEDEIIARTNISEETKRVVRQVRKKRPGFFWTLARLAFETYNDTRSAIQQINDIIGESFEPDTTTRPPGKTNSMMTTVKPTAPSDDQNNVSSNLADVNVTATVTNVTTTARTTTTARPFKFTRNSLQDLLRRNLRGLVRLFNIEWQDALNQSEITVKEFRKDLGNKIGGFLRDNPNAY